MVTLMPYRYLRACGKNMELQETAVACTNRWYGTTLFNKRRDRKRKITEEMRENFGFGLSLKYIYCLVIMLMLLWPWTKIWV